VRNSIEKFGTKRFRREELLGEKFKARKRTAKDEKLLEFSLQRAPPLLMSCRLPSEVFKASKMIINEPHSFDSPVPSPYLCASLLS
jgi:hypothetical protein